jgi:hypothetical protein
VIDREASWRHHARKGQLRQAARSRNYRSRAHVAGRPIDGLAHVSEHPALRGPGVGAQAFGTAGLRSAGDKIGTFDDVARGLPRLYRNCGRRVFWRAVYQFIRIHHVDEHVTLRIAAAHDLHLLKN